MNEISIKDPDTPEDKKQWYETSFKAVPKETNALVMKW